MNDKSAVPYHPTEAEKSGALSHLFYELQQLLVSARLSAEHPAVQNAFVESYLVHVRVLLDFFERDKRSIWRDGNILRENDDVLGADFSFPVRRVGLAQIYRERLNKDLVHLAYSRGTRLPESKGWPARDVVAPVAARGARFIEYVGDNRLASTPGYSLANWAELREGLLSYARSCGVSDGDT